MAEAPKTDSSSFPWEAWLLSYTEPGRNQAAYFWSLNLGLGSSC